MKAGRLTWEERIAGALQDFRDELAIQTDYRSVLVRRSVDQLLSHREYVNRLTAVISNDSGGNVFPHFRE